MTQSPSLRPVPVPDLRLLPDGRRWTVAQRLQELQSLEPVCGWLQVWHHGSQLLVRGEASTTIERPCDRCLQPVAVALVAKVEEWIGLEDPGDSGEAPVEIVLDGGNELPLDSLDPQGSFDPEHWLFEQLSLVQPLRCLCRDDCPGLLADPGTVQPLDPRWQALRTLQSPDDS
ncbi:MAG: DUF177 domain-containing protein [Synechococcus sp. Tobar2m-G35]|nr:DUF177 domain-containing protein [Synechococcus sp. Tobar2m-G35]